MSKLPTRRLKHSSFAEGQSPEDVAREFPQFTVADVLEALTFAAETLREREISLSTSA